MGQLLARRRRLTAEEIPTLLAGLPGLLDELKDPTRIGPFLTDVLVRFTAPSSGMEDGLARRVEDWPAFSLRLRVAGVVSRTATVLFPLGQHLPTRMAGLIYELLGGKIRTKPNGAFQYTPIAGIGEEGNLALEEMLTGSPCADCESLWKRWLRKSGVRAGEHAALGFSIPKWAVRFGRPGVLMELVPQQRRQPSIRFVARDEFRVGSSLRTADLPLEVRNSKTGVDQSRHIDGNHLIAQVTEKGIGLWDGDGRSASANGTACDGVRLEPGRGKMLRQGSEIALAPGVCDCRLRADALSQPAGPLLITNLSEWRGAPRSAARCRPAPIAAMVFQAAGDAIPLRQVAWLFRGIGLRTAKGGLLEWAGDGSADFSCMHAHGVFWLACMREPEERVAVDDAFLSPGQIMPLDAQNLDFGRQQFAVRVLGA